VTELGGTSGLGSTIQRLVTDLHTRGSRVFQWQIMSAVFRVTFTKYILPKYTYFVVKIRTF